MMMALAGQRDLPCILVPGGVTLPPDRRRGRRQDPDDRRALRPRRDHPGGGRRAGLPGLRHPGRRLPVPGHGGHQPGRGRGAGPVAAALGARALRPADLARHGAPLGPGADGAWRPAGLTCGDILTEDALHNAMVVHAAFGGSTNLLLHIPAIAHAAGLRPPDGRGLDAHQPRRAAPGRRAAQRPGRPPHGPRLPGRRRARGDAALARAGPAAPGRAHRPRAAAGRDAGRVGAAASAAQRLRDRLLRGRRRRPGRRDPVAGTGPSARPDQHRHLSRRATWRPKARSSRARPSTRSVVDADGVYRKTGPARVFTSERAAIAAIKGQARRRSGRATSSC